MAEGHLKMANGMPSAISARRRGAHALAALRADCTRQPGEAESGAIKLLVACFFNARDVS